MSRPPLRSSRSLAICSLAFIAAAATTGRAIAQPAPARVASHPQNDAASQAASAMSADSDAGVTPDVPTSASRRPGPYRRPFLAVLGAVPLATYVGPLAPRPSEVVSPADRFVTAHLIGGGYVVNPRFRFGVIGVFSEALTGLPSGADAWQLGGVAPIAIGTFNHFIVGGGPIVGYRSGGKFQSDIGTVVLTGASIPIGVGLALNLATPVTAMFARRVTVSAGVAIGVSKVF